MVAFMSDNLFDSGLNYMYNLQPTNLAVYICNAQPTTYTQATSTDALGAKTGKSCAAPEDHTSGRKVVLAAITDGSITVSGTASHFAIVKTNVTTELLATTNLASSQSVTNGNTFTLTAITVAIPDPTT